MNSYFRYMRQRLKGRTRRTDAEGKTIAYSELCCVTRMAGKTCRRMYVNQYGHGILFATDGTSTDGAASVLADSVSVS